MRSIQATIVDSPHPSAREQTQQVSVRGAQWLDQLDDAIVREVYETLQSRLVHHDQAEALHWEAGTRARRQLRSWITTTLIRHPSARWTR